MTQGIVNKRRYPDRKSRPLRLTRPLIAVLITACATGCERDGRSSESQPAAQESPSDRIDQLRALPYVGYVEGSEDDERSGVVTFDRERSCPGYNLYSVYRQASAYLIDADGNVVQSWRDPEGHHWGRCELLPDGDLLVPGADAADDQVEAVSDTSRYLLRLSWDGEVIWKKKISAHHDVEVTPAGRILTLTIEHRFESKISRQVPVRDNMLTLLSDDGLVLEERSLYKVLDSNAMIFTFQKVKPKGRPAVRPADLIHANSVEWMRHRHLEDKHGIYGSGNVLVCTRNQDTIAIINWETGKLVWAWGQGELSGPHDATVLESGNILLFDNGLGRDWSRVIELDPLANNIVWEYRAPEPTDFYTTTLGANQRLPNGNTLITSSDQGHVFEVTAEGEIVWEYFAPHFNEEGERATVVRTDRYEEGFVRGILDQFPGREDESARSRRQPNLDAARSSGRAAQGK